MDEIFMKSPWISSRESQNPYEIPWKLALIHQPAIVNYGSWWFNGDSYGFYGEHRMLAAWNLLKHAKTIGDSEKLTMNSPWTHHELTVCCCRNHHLRPTKNVPSQVPSASRPSWRGWRPGSSLPRWRRRPRSGANPAGGWFHGWKWGLVGDLVGDFHLKPSWNWVFRVNDEWNWGSFLGIYDEDLFSSNTMVNGWFHGD